MNKQYNPQEHEGKIYKQWEESGAFSPTDNPKAKPFCIIMPPPNANDPLHVGHAMFVTLEDILIRYHRMKGKAALWLPGTDHAGIETQFVFEKKLKEKGQSRFDFEREKLFEMISEYVKANSGVAVEQMKKLGASADWGRYKFTLDEDIVADVIETFEELHKDGMVYRDMRLVNYCTKCGTAYSELEVEHVERKDPLYYIAYGPFTLATVRPETKFGDTAVAVNPDDTRYQEYVGQEIEVEGLLGKFKMKVVADEYVDREFGTGVVKITPAHDPNDYEVWQRHKDEIPGLKQVIGFDGKMNELAGNYEGLSVEQARVKVVADLESKGLLTKVDKAYKHNVGVCYRCGKVLEPLPMPQFFVKTGEMTRRGLKAMDEGEVKVFGAGHDKILKHWLTNLKEWNVSRQIVWGIRMPVWYEVSEGDLKPGEELEVVFLDSKGESQSGEIREMLKKFELKEIARGLQSLRAGVGAKYVVSPTAPGEGYIQETDTFDTWFSSAQWPFVTLKNAKEGDFERFYPTQVMETAYDILMFWVMRMLMVGIYKTGKVPFEKVYLHGLIRDEKGKKMSKSKGNVINPLDVVSEYGADALRMALVIRSSPGLDKNVGERDFRGMRNLTNKIWNASRFVIMSMEDKDVTGSSGEGDGEFREKLDEIVASVGQQLEDLRLGLAAETVYNEFWHWFCDEGIEKAKKGEVSYKALLEGLVVFLKLMHPFVPFVTEAVYQELKNNRKVKDVGGEWLKSEMLISALWPESKTKYSS